MGHRTPILPRFTQFYLTLPDNLGADFINDGIYELPGAWKFFTRLPAGKSALVYCSGLTAVPLAFARHLRRVEIAGLNTEEAEILSELARLKQLDNLEVLPALAAITGPYDQIIVLAGAREFFSGQLAAFAERVQTAATGEEEWLLFVRGAGAPALADWSKRMLRRLLGRGAPALPAGAVRLCLRNSPALSREQVVAIFPALLQLVRAELRVSPDFMRPKWISCDTGGRAVRPARAAAESGAGRLLIAGKSAAAASSFLSRLLQHLSPAEESGWQARGPGRVLSGGKVQVELWRQAQAAPQQALLKLPLIASAEKRLQENATTLARLHQAEGLAPEQRRLFPVTLAAGKFEQQRFQLESFLPGRSLDRLPAAVVQDPELIHQILQCWLGIQEKFLRPVRVDDEIFRRLFLEVLEAVQEWLALAPEVRRRLQRLADYWRRQFGGRTLACGLVHGDFSIKNVMIAPESREITGLIDWDLADFFSLPTMDVLHFFIRLDSRSFREVPPVIALRLIKSSAGLPPRHFNEVAERYGYQPADWPGVVMLYWLHRQRGYLGSPKNLNARFVRRQFHQVLELFEREILP
ncbi:phosphotransferase [candidate division KSB1 bacterium]|nr:aminoglycoside phosphotransferase family protein [bacterium]NUM64388.1 phosphotransferase [candidate division KSB1 bacterium]